MKAAVAAVLALGVAGGCAATQPATPPALAEAAPPAVIPAAGASAGTALAADPKSTKIAAPIAEAVAKLVDDAASSATGKPHGATLYSTPFVKVDAAGRIHAYVHVTALGDEERAALTAAGASIEVAMERLRIVQAWLPYDRVTAVAALPFVARISPPSYATPR